MTTVWITGDQCMPDHPALAGCAKSETVVLFVESFGRSRSLPYHKRKLVLIFATMRGLADELRAAGWTVDYRSAQAEYESPLGDHVRTYAPKRFRTMQQTQYGLTERLRAAVRAFGCELDVVPHTNFISDQAEFAELFTGGRQRVTMETFYRRMRKKTGLLMDGDEPVGGTWNLDAENRQPPKRGMSFPPQPKVRMRRNVSDAMALVEANFPTHPGTTAGFDIPTTRADALAYADEFFDERLDLFGPYEDAMVAGETRLYHSKLSAAINVGLLHPLELAERAELAYRTRRARLSSVEGFIRQLIGWREFVWQTYWKLMPEYRERNALGATLPVPTHWSDADTKMRCQRETLRSVLDLGWAHHIARLMILGNFALLAGVEPQAATDWFWYMFVDGYDWVMVPNVIGMTLHADGGFVGTKPYAASANYINKMSDYCGGCAYDAKQTVGDGACPYNALYWDFIARNQERFANNPRMTMPLRNWQRRDAHAKDAIRARAGELRERLAGGGRL